MTLPGTMELRAQLESESDEPPVAVPVVPPGRIADFRREWRRRPELRRLIRAAGRLDEEEVARSPVIRCLWELAHSREWLMDGRGLCCDFHEFYEVLR